MPDVCPHGLLGGPCSECNRLSNDLFYDWTAIGDNKYELFEPGYITLDTDTVFLDGHFTPLELIGIARDALILMSRKGD